MLATFSCLTSGTLDAALSNSESAAGQQNTLLGEGDSLQCIEVQQKVVLCSYMSYVKLYDSLLGCVFHLHRIGFMTFVYFFLNNIQI